MKILHILNDGPLSAPDQIIEVQSKDNDVEVIDLSKKNMSYDFVIERIFGCDKVVSWQAAEESGTK